MTTPKLGLSKTLQTDFETAETQITAALKAEGFGILTEIDVTATFKKKLDIDFQPYKILGACNPKLAHQALTLTGDVGMLLPCNVTLTQTEDNTITISIIDPEQMLGVIDDPQLNALACDAKERLERALAAV